MNILIKCKWNHFKYFGKGLMCMFLSMYQDHLKLVEFQVQKYLKGYCNQLSQAGTGINGKHRASPYRNANKGKRMKISLEDKCHDICEMNTV